MEGGEEPADERHNPSYKTRPLPVTAREALYMWRKASHSTGRSFRSLPPAPLWVRALVSGEGGGRDGGAGAKEVKQDSIDRRQVNSALPPRAGVASWPDEGVDHQLSSIRRSPKGWTADLRPPSSTEL